MSPSWASMHDRRLQIYVPQIISGLCIVTEAEVNTMWRTRDPSQSCLGYSDWKGHYKKEREMCMNMYDLWRSMIAQGTAFLHRVCHLHWFLPSESFSLRVYWCPFLMGVFECSRYLIIDILNMIPHDCTTTLCWIVCVSKVETLNWRNCTCFHCLSPCPCTYIHLLYICMFGVYRNLQLWRPADQIKKRYLWVTMKKIMVFVIFQVWCNNTCIFTPHKMVTPGKVPFFGGDESNKTVGWPPCEYCKLTFTLRLHKDSNILMKLRHVSGRFLFDMILPQLTFDDL